jgi:hypothetical protein
MCAGWGIFVRYTGIAVDVEAIFMASGNNGEAAVLFGCIYHGNPNSQDF